MGLSTEDDFKQKIQDGYIVESLVPRIATALDFEAATLAK